MQKILSQAGVASRRASEQLMLDGRVTVNGQTVRELGTKADPAADDIRVDGRRIRVPERRLYFLLNKPRGYVTTRSDPQKRPTVLDLVNVRDYVYPVGRLDFDSEGLLLLTNDGDLASHLTHPSHGVNRVYEAQVLGVPDPHDLERLSRGVVVEGRRTGAGARRTAARQAGRRALDAADHHPRRTEPPGPEHVRGDRPSGRSPSARRDRTDSRRSAETRSVAGADGGRSRAPARRGRQRGNENARSARCYRFGVCGPSRASRSAKRAPLRMFFNP